MASGRGEKSKEHNMFPKKTYQTRRALIKRDLSTGLLLFLGNDEQAINFADNPYPFRQDSSFLYYFGIREPGLAALIDIDEDVSILFGEELTIDEIIWMGQRESLSERGKRAGVDEVRPFAALTDYLNKAKKRGQAIHYLPPYRPQNKICLWEYLGISPDAAQQKASVDFIKAIARQRSVKSKEELIEIEKAVNVSADMHLLAMQMAQPGVSELQIANAVQAFAQNSGGALAYPIILSKHGEILHNHSHTHTLEEGDLVLHDAGAETEMGYAGDLTRTFPVSERFSQQQGELFDIVHSALQQASASMKPGTRFLDVHFTACRALVDGLKAIGLMKGDTEEAVAAGAHTLFFQCGTGHMMGLDVHDMEDLGEQYVGYTDLAPKDQQTFGLKSLRLGKELESGYVVTVEPGIYFIPDLIDLWKAESRHKDFINYPAVEGYRNFGGVRLEDNYVITESGYSKLGKHLPCSRREIEEIKLSSK